MAAAGTGGGTKKFLYSGPKSRQAEAEEEQWNFTPRKNASQASAVDLDDVWSIKRNVGIGAAQQNKLNLNANKTFYSRHGGMKDKSTSPHPGESEGSWTPTRRSGGNMSNGRVDPLSPGRQTDGQTNKCNQDEFDF